MSPVYRYKVLHIVGTLDLFTNMLYNACILMKGGKSMAKSTGNKVTSARAASAASKVLRDGRTGATSKTAAGSALAQRPSRGKK